MDRYERERILGEWGVRDGTARAQAEGRALERDLADLGGKGRPTRRRYRNFRPDAATYVASLGGPLPYMQRLREIHDLIALHEARLAERWTEVAAECRDDEAEFERRWRAVAGRWSFYELNALVERHNRCYPIEARLPMDPRTGDFVLVGGRPYRRRPLDASWVLERFPPRLALVRAA